MSTLQKRLSQWVHNQEDIYQFNTWIHVYFLDSNLSIKFRCSIRCRVFQFYWFHAKSPKFLQLRILLTFEDFITQHISNPHFPGFPLFPFSVKSYQFCFVGRCCPLWQILLSLSFSFVLPMWSWDFPFSPLLMIPFRADLAMPWPQPFLVIIPQPKKGDNFQYWISLL